MPSVGCVCIGGALVLLPGMLFPISRGIKAAANLRLTKLFFMNCSIIPFRDTLACQILEMRVRLTYFDSFLL